MILYFSATGNNKYVAQELSEATGERMVALRDLVCGDVEKLVVADGEDFGVVMPTYREGLPSILLDWLRHVEVRLEGGAHYCYFVAVLLH